MTSFINSAWTHPLSISSWPAFFIMSFLLRTFFSNSIILSSIMFEKTLNSALCPVIREKHFSLIRFSSPKLTSGDICMNLISSHSNAIVLNIRSQSYSNASLILSEDNILMILTSGILFSIFPAIIFPVANPPEHTKSALTVMGFLCSAPPT